MRQPARTISNDKFNLIEACQSSTCINPYGPCVIAVIITVVDTVAPPMRRSNEEFVSYGTDGNVDALRSALDESMDYLDVRGRCQASATIC